MYLTFILLSQIKNVSRPTGNATRHEWKYDRLEDEVNRHNGYHQLQLKYLLQIYKIICLCEHIAEALARASKGAHANEDLET